MKETRFKLPKKVVACWTTTRATASRISMTAWVFAGLLLLAGGLAALHTVMTVKDASLKLKVQHSLRTAQLSVWIDGDLAYSGKLTGASKKKFGLIAEPVQGNLSETLPIASGSHQVKVRTTEGTSYQESTITGNFARNNQKTLSVTVRPGDVSLYWQSTSGAVADSSASESLGWQRYTSALFLTAAGSIMSALAGFAIRELPRHIAARQGEARKV